jgi:hypothetical protein
VGWFYRDQTKPWMNEDSWVDVVQNSKTFLSCSHSLIVHGHANFYRQRNIPVTVDWLAGVTCKIRIISIHNRVTF